MRYRSIVAMFAGAALISAGGCGDRVAAAPDHVAMTTDHVAAAARVPSATVTAAEVVPDVRVGAVFLGGADLHTCTGAVLHSRTGDLVLTAAHCLAGGVPAAFVPGFQGSAAPADTWQVVTVYLDPRWIERQDPLADFAIARVRNDSGESVEAHTGSAFTLGSAPAAGTAVSVTGYALGVGGSPVNCHAETSLAGGGFPALGCGGLVDGTSGAPWIDGSTVTGLIGGLDGGGCDESISYSPPFGASTAALLARAQDGGPGDVAPNTFDSDC